MPNYNNGKIYKIVCNITGDQYIGSTVQSLCVRKGGHVSDSTKEKQKCMVSTIILRGNYDMCLIENYPCTNKEELHKRERYYIESTQCINKRIPTRTPRERYLDTREQVIDESKKYYWNNKDKKKEYDVAYRLRSTEIRKQKNDKRYLKLKLLKELPFYNNDRKKESGIKYRLKTIEIKRQYQSKRYLTIKILKELPFYNARIV